MTPQLPGPVLVTGMGLMGASLAAALKAIGVEVLVHHHRPETARRAEALGCGRAVEDLTTPAAIAVVCTPVSTIPAIVRAIAAGPTPIITDVGSTKGGLVADLADLADRFIGSHPMCGSHRHGLEAADPDLYRGRLTILTPSAATPPDRLAILARLWRTVGCRLVEIDPQEHDRLVAQASHLPHVMANITAALLTPAAAPLCAGGFRDTTRVAAGSTTMWADILTANAEAVETMALAAERRLAELRHLMAHQDKPGILRWLSEGHEGRALYERINADGHRPETPCAS